MEPGVVVASAVASSTDSAAGASGSASENGPAGTGRLIAFEGCDGTGKTTQINILRDKIASECNRESVVVSFPDRSTEIGKLIDGMLKGATSSLPVESSHLLFAANRLERREFIEGEIAKGTIVLCDRYVHSGLAYSLALAGLEASDDEAKWFRTCDELMPKPDLVFFMNNSCLAAGVEGQTTLLHFHGSGSSSPEIYDGSEFQKKVFSNFRRCCYEEGKEHHWRVFCASDPVWKIAREMFEIVRDELMF